MTRYSILSFFCFSRGILGVLEFGYWDWFVLGTRTFREGGVMIRWLWPLGRVWAPAIIPLAFCCILYGRALGLYGDTLTFTLIVV